MRPGVKVAIWAVVIFLIYFMATDPHGAGHALTASFDALRSFGNWMARLVNHL